MPKLIMTKGLPASGKTTWAKTLVDKGNAKRVNKDDLRAMLDNGKWSKQNESFVLEVRDHLVGTILSGGHDCIVDDTNLAPKHEPALRALAVKYEAEFVIKDFTDVSLEECLRRDQNRPNYVGEKVIKSMYNSFLGEKPDVAQYATIEHNPDLPSCIIVDIDGTLAHMSGRSPYDYSKVHEDVVDENVREIIWRYRHPSNDDFVKDTYVIVVSGREDDCKDVTQKWLNDTSIPHDELHMRKSGDKRSDTIVKQEIFDEWIRNRYNVRFVLDDRDRVVKMWRELGLKVLQVAEGDF